MIDEPMKHATDQLAAGSSIMTLVAYWTGMLSALAEKLAPVLTCMVLLITFAWYVARFVDRARKNRSDAEPEGD